MSISTEENNCTYIASRGFAKSCDIKTNNFNSSSSYKDDIMVVLPDAKSNSTVYFCNTAIKYDFMTIFNAIREPVVLVTGDSDDTMDESFFGPIIAYIESNKIVKWYCQNCTYDHPKIIRMPIGLDYHSTQDIRNMHITPVDHDNMLKDIANHAKPMHNRIIACYSNFHFEINRHPDRQDAVNKIPSHLVFYESSRTERITSYKNQSQFAFVLSPHGAGLDCHRTWEALILGCIPIVKKSGLDPLYEALPVLIVNDWTEINRELLMETLEKFKNMTFNYERLTLEYWKSRFACAVWETNDQNNYNYHTQKKSGQIYLDECAAQITNYASNLNYKTFLEIGTWNGLGSTKCFSDGFKQRNDDYIFYSLECNKDKCLDASKLYVSNDKIHILNEVIWNEEPPNFYEIFPQCLSNDIYKHWNEVDIANMKKCKLFLDRSNLPNIFDVVLLDGGEFTTYFEFQALKNRCKILMLDDAFVDKCRLIIQEIEADPSWKIIHKYNIRNGFVIAEKLV
jgi:hypothetical protein